MKRINLEPIGAIFMCIVFFVVLGLVGEIENTYLRKDCVVTKVENKEVIAVDEYGDEWSWYIEKDDELKSGDIVTLKMHTSFTLQEIEDDFVKNYKIQK